MITFRYLCITAFAVLALTGHNDVALAQSQVVNFNRGAVLTADQLRALQAGKLDATNGIAQSLTVTQTMTMPAGQFSGPQSGISLGAGSYTYPVRDPEFPGSVTVSLSNTPKVVWHSLIAPNQPQIVELATGDLAFYTGDNAREFKFYNNAEFYGWMIFTGIALANPGSGAHFVCVNDTNVTYRSDTACK